MAVIGTVVIAGVAGGFGGNGGDDPQTASTSATSSTTSTVAATQPIAVESTEAPIVTTHLDQPLGMGMAGDDVEQVQTRLEELGFELGEVDGQYGNLTRMAMWAYQKLVLNVANDEVTDVVTDEMWQFMQRPIKIEPRRWHSKGQTTRNHTEIYLPQQVVIFFVDDEPALISHMSHGTGQEWREEVRIDPGEFGNENGTEPLVRGEIGVSVTPGGIFKYDRIVEGLRNSALGGMWDPAYFNYGIAIHGAINVPETPASHGCIRVPQTIGEMFHEFIDIGDSVFVWDGKQEPEVYASNAGAAYPRGQVPIFNRIDPDYSTTTTTPTTTTPPTTTAPTVRPTVPFVPSPTSPATPAPTQPPTQPATTTSPPVAEPHHDVNDSARRLNRRGEPAQPATTSTRDRGPARGVLSVRRRRTPRVRRRRIGGLGSDHEPATVVVGAHTDNASLVAPIQPDRDAEHSGQRAHEALVVGRQGGEGGVRLLRLALAVVAGDLGDDLDLVVGEPRQLGVADHVVGVEVMLAVGDDEADVGQHRSRFEMLALGRQTVHGRRSRRTTPRRARRHGSSARGRRRTDRSSWRIAAPRDVPQVMDVRPAASPTHRVEEDALPQRSLRVDE